MLVTMVSCTIFSQWPPKGPKCRKSENRKSTMVIFFFAARPHVIWSQIGQGITMWTPTCQFQTFLFLPNYYPPLPRTLAPKDIIPSSWRLFLKSTNFDDGQQCLPAGQLSQISNFLPLWKIFEKVGNLGELWKLEIWKALFQLILFGLPLDLSLLSPLM